ncbi:hypothetical protein J2J99_24440 (plasmid) [Rhizobium binae]|nr:hypothetical protein [Rhizobium binae]QSY85202.1 hypothetical protein J2J99_24440 [Rhizobium binae]
MRLSFAAPLKKHSHTVCRPFVLDVVVGLAPDKCCAIETGCCHDRLANIGLADTPRLASESVLQGPANANPILPVE